MSTAAAAIDLTNLARDLERAAQQAPVMSDRVLGEAAEQIKQTMLLLVPRRTGRLAGSIDIVATPGRYEIGPIGVEYASYVEFGTGARGEFPTGAYKIEPKKPGGVLAFKSGGKTVFVSFVMHPGIRPKPYVRPAAQAYIDKLPEQMLLEAVQMIVGRAA